LWGLLKTCKAIQRNSHKEDGKNTEMMEIAQNRLKDVYSKHTDMNIANVSLMK